MRDYLFRGKRKDNGEWVYGNFVRGCVDDFAYIVEFGNKDLCRNFVDVIPETVGQYTGLTDNNGKKIFEGDVVQNELFRFVIKYGAYIPRAYCKKIYNHFETIGFYAFDGEREYQLINYAKTIEVIGNIHDNPDYRKIF